MGGTYAEILWLPVRGLRPSRSPSGTTSLSAPTAARRTTADLLRETGPLHPQPGPRRRVRMEVPVPGNLSCAPAPACGERTLRSEDHCRCCGAKLPPEGCRSSLQSHRAAPASGNFDYSSLYRQYRGDRHHAPRTRMQGRPIRPPLARTSMMDGISCKDWTCLHRPLRPPSYLTHLQPDGADAQQGLP